MSPNEQDLTFEWSRRIGGDPKHGHNELQLLRQIARARGHETTHTMNEVAALRAIAASYGKSNVGYMNELDALRAIVDGMGATPSNLNLHDMNEIDCLWAIIRAGGGAAGYDADAADYFARVVANAGTLSDATKTAVNAYFVGTKADGDWDLITRGSLLCGGELAAALVPFKVGGGSATDTNNNFVAGDYSLATGLTGNGTTKYLNTGQLANALSANDTHLSVYNRTSGAAGGNVHIGVLTTGRVLLFAPGSDGTIYSDQYDGTSGRLTFAITGAAGFIVGSRVTSSDHQIFRNGSSVATSATVGGSLPALPFFVFCYNSNATPTSFTSHNLGAYLIGKGVSAAAAARMNTRMQTVMTALGRNV